VENLIVYTVSETSLQVEWDAPTVNVDCVHKYSISYTNMEYTTRITRTFIPRLRSDLVETIVGLSPCVDYLVSKIIPSNLEMAWLFTIIKLQYQFRLKYFLNRQLENKVQ